MVKKSFKEIVKQAKENFKQKLFQIVMLNEMVKKGLIKEVKAI